MLGSKAAHDGSRGRTRGQWARAADSVPGEMRLGGRSRRGFSQASHKTWLMEDTLTDYYMNVLAEK